MLFKVQDWEGVYGVYAVTKSGDGYDKFLIYSHRERRFEWVYVSMYTLA